MQGSTYNRCYSKNNFNYTSNTGVYNSENVFIGYIHSNQFKDIIRVDNNNLIFNINNGLNSFNTLGISDLAFTMNQTFLLNLGAQLKFVKNINNDQYDDLIVYEEGNNVNNDIVRFYINNVGNGFNTPTAISIIHSTWQFQVGDYNNDSYEDLLAFDEISGIVYTSLNNGNGIFLPLVTCCTLNATKTWQIENSDIDGNNDIDLICFNITDHQINVYKNNGSNSFVLDAAYNSNTSDNTNIKVANLYNTIYSDVLWYDEVTGNVHILKNIGTGFVDYIWCNLLNININAIASPNPNTSSWEVKVADFTGDGLQDILAYDKTDNRPYIGFNDYTNDKFNINQWDFSYPNPGPNLNVGNPQIADMNSDNRPDIVYHNVQNNKMTLALNAPLVEGYCWPLSVKNDNAESIKFYILGNGNSIVDIVKLSSLGSTVTETLKNTQTLPAFTAQFISEMAWKEGCNWKESYSMSIPNNWASGYYAMRLTSSTGEITYITFVVKETNITCNKLLVLANTNTWQLYNGWCGSIYDYEYAHDGINGSEATPISHRSRYIPYYIDANFQLHNYAKFSFKRPSPVSKPNDDSNITNSHLQIQLNHLVRAELWIYSWLEANGYEPSLITDNDLDANSMSLNNYKTLLFGTHPEYWTDAMYDNAKTFQQQGMGISGGNLISLGGNSIYERCNYASTNVGGITNHQVILSNGIDNQIRDNYLFNNYPNGIPTRRELDLIGVKTANFAGSGNASEQIKITNNSYPPFLNFGNYTYIGSCNENHFGVAGTIFNAIHWETDANLNQSTLYGSDLQKLSTTDNAYSEFIYVPPVNGLNNHGFVFAGGSISLGGSLVCDAGIQTMMHNVLHIEPSMELLVNNIICNNGVGSIEASICSPSSFELTTLPPLMPGTLTNNTGVFLNLSAGSYSITCTDAIGYTITSTFTITQPPIISFTNNISTNITCNNANNGTINVTASGGTGPITYSIAPNGIINAQGVASNLSGGTYTVVASDASNCSMSTTFAIINPLAVAFASANFTNITCTSPLANDGSITVLASGGVGGFVYTLDYPGGQLQNNTGSFNPIVAHSYTVTASDANGCSMSTIIELVDPASGNFCCSTATNPQSGANVVALPNVILQTAPTASNLLALYSGGTSTITGKTYYIDGTLTIDDNITFVGCTLWFTPNSQILFQVPGVFTLDFNSSTLQASCDWWGGIIADDPQQKVTIQNNSVIKSAYLGLMVSNNALLQVSDSKFENNGMACILMNAISDPAYMGYILNTEFKGGANMPLPYTHTQKGIYMNDVSNMIIGDYNSPLSVNSFTAMQCGIHINNSANNGSATIQLFNNRFSNIHAPIPNYYVATPEQYIVDQCYTSPWGAGIYVNSANTSNQINFLSSITIDNHPNFVGLDFSGCDKAIVGEGPQMTVTNQQTSNCLLGIMCHSPFQRKYVLNDNNIENAHIGIQLFGRQLSSEINNNVILLNSNILSQIGPVSITPPVGIKYQRGQMSASGSPVYIINNNSIALNTITGVGIQNTYGDIQTQTKGNTINFTSNSMGSTQSHKIRSLIGVWANRCTDADFDDNNNHGFSNPLLYDARNSYGMYLDNSPWCRWSCNKADYTQFGFYIWGNNETTVDKNTYNKLEYNEFPWFFLDGPAAEPGTLGDIGDVGISGTEPANEFLYVAGIGTLNYNPNLYKVYRYSTIGNGNVIYTNSSFLGLSECGALSPNAGYDVQPNGLSYSNPCTNFNIITDPNSEPIDEEAYISYIQAVVGDSVQYINYSDVAGWMDRYRVYSHLDIDSILRYSEPDLLSFYNSNAMQNVGHLREANRAIDLLYDTSTNYSNRNARLNAAQQANNNVSSGEVWEEYEKSINDAMILLSTAPADSLPQAMKEEIGTIAYMCPYEGGNAVLKARTLWLYWQPNALWDDRTLCMQAQNKNQDNSYLDMDSLYANVIKEISIKNTFTEPIIKQDKIAVSQQESDIRVYPNPASNYVIVSYQSETDGMFKLYNSFGEVILTTQLSLLNTKTHIALNNLANGIYHYEIEFANKVKTIGKITLIN